MKIDLRIFLALLAATALNAAPLTSTTAVHSRPDASAPAIAVLNAGTEPTPAVGTALPLGAGWSAIELTGAHDAYIQNKDMNKEMDVRPGSPFRTAPKADAPVLTTMEPGDQITITGYHGKWSQVKVTKKIVGYIQGWSAGSASSVANTARPTSTPTPAPTKPAPFSPAPAAPAAVASGGAGRPAQMVNLGDGGSASLPRLFQGKFVSTRVLLRPRRPYDFQLNDTAGERYAYLDISRLLQTEQIDKYIDHTVTVYGTAKAVPDTKDIVVEVESLQLH